VIIRARALILLGALAGCAGGLPEPAPGDVDRARARWPDVTAARLRDGRSLYQARCSSCHRPVAPGAIAPAEWPEHVLEMKTRAGLSDAEASAIERYLVTMSERGR
jgi:mono/diheme cytochrome c family protein